MDFSLPLSICFSNSFQVALRVVALSCGHGNCSGALLPLLFRRFRENAGPWEDPGAKKVIFSGKSGRFWENPGRKLMTFFALYHWDFGKIRVPGPWEDPRETVIFSGKSGTKILMTFFHPGKSRRNMWMTFFIREISGKSGTMGGSGMNGTLYQQSKAL